MCSRLWKGSEIYGKCRKIVLKNEYQLVNGELWKTTYKSLKIKGFLLNAFYISEVFFYKKSLKNMSVGLMKNNRKDVNYFRKEF